MSEHPEQVLPQQRVAAARGIEERPVEGALHLQQQVAGDQRRKGEQDHRAGRSEEHTSELQSLMRISYAVFCLKKKNMYQHYTHITKHTTHTPTSHTNKSKIALDDRPN